MLSKVSRRASKLLRFRVSGTNCGRYFSSNSNTQTEETGLGDTVPIDSVLQTTNGSEAIDTGITAESLEAMEARLHDIQQEKTLFSDLNISGFDFGNMQMSLEPTLKENIPTIWRAVRSYINIWENYAWMDEASRNATLFISEDLNLGMGAAIVMISVGIKLIFLPFQLKSQTNAMRTRLYQPEFNEFQRKIKALSQKGNTGGVNAMRNEMKLFRQEKGLASLAPLGNFLQMPILLTWFVSLRYMSMSPNLYPGLMTDGFFWFQDLTQVDPYYLLPFCATFLSYLGVKTSTAVMGSNPMGGIGKYIRFLRFAPFFSLPVFISFPSLLTLYWSMISSMHLITTLLVSSKWYKKWASIDGYIPGTILYKINTATRDRTISRKIEFIEKTSEEIEAEKEKKQKALEKKKILAAKLKQSSFKAFVETKKDNAAQPMRRVQVMRGAPKKKKRRRKKRF